MQSPGRLATKESLVQTPWTLKKHESTESQPNMTTDQEMPPITLQLRAGYSTKMDDPQPRSNSGTQIDSEMTTSRNVSQHNQLTSHAIQHLSENNQQTQKDEDYTEMETQNGTQRGLSSNRNSLVTPNQQMFAITVRSSMKKHSKFGKSTTSRASPNDKNFPYVIAQKEARPVGK